MRSLPSSFGRDAGWEQGFSSDFARLCDKCQVTKEQVSGLHLPPGPREQIAQNTVSL